MGHGNINHEIKKRTIKEPCEEPCEEKKPCDPKKNHVKLWPGLWFIVFLFHDNCYHRPQQAKILKLPVFLR